MFNWDNPKIFQVNIPTILQKIVPKFRHFYVFVILQMLQWNIPIALNLNFPPIFQGNVPKVEYTLILIDYK